LKGGKKSKKDKKKWSSSFRMRAMRLILFYYSYSVLFLLFSFIYSINH
jgi:hypothetical protein